MRGYQGGWFTMNPNDDEDASIADDTCDNTPLTPSPYVGRWFGGQSWRLNGPSSSWRAWVLQVVPVPELLHRGPEMAVNTVPRFLLTCAASQC